jgi:RHS repeat-associated protein
MPTSYGFTGQRLDPSGLQYFNARYYDSSVGQFTSADSVQGPNRYAYVSGNPETMTDPTGEMGLRWGLSPEGFRLSRLSRPTKTAAPPMATSYTHFCDGCEPLPDRYHYYCLQVGVECEDSDPAPRYCLNHQACDTQIFHANFLKGKGIAEVGGAVAILASLMFASAATDGIGAAILAFSGTGWAGVMTMISFFLAGVADFIQGNTRADNANGDITIGTERANLQNVGILRLGSGLTGILSGVFSAFGFVRANGLGALKTAVFWVVTLVKALWSLGQTIIGVSGTAEDVQNLPPPPSFQDLTPTPSPTGICYTNPNGSGPRNGGIPCI